MKHQTLTISPFRQYVVATSQSEANEIARLIGHTSLEEAQKHLDELDFTEYQTHKVYTVETIPSSPAD